MHGHPHFDSEPGGIVAFLMKPHIGAVRAREHLVLSELQPNLMQTLSLQRLHLLQGLNRVRPPEEHDVRLRTVHAAHTQRHARSVVSHEHSEEVVVTG